MSRRIVRADHFLRETGAIPAILVWEHLTSRCAHQVTLQVDFVPFASLSTLERVTRVQIPSGYNASLVCFGIVLLNLPEQPYKVVPRPFRDSKCYTSVGVLCR